MPEEKGPPETIGPAEMKVCVWTEDSEGDWETRCGEYFSLIDGTPEENKYQFCPACGRLIIEKPWDVFEEEEE